MKRFQVLFILGLWVLGGAAYSETAASLYTVGTWQGFRPVAVSYTFDDNCPNQLAKAVPMFNEFGFTLTLFTITSPSTQFPADWAGLQAAASHGHEIASHTVSHTTFAGMNDTLQIAELQGSQDAISAHIMGTKCATIAYPYCVAGKLSLVGQFYFAARICSGSLVSNNPPDFLNISSIICGDLGSIKTSKNFSSLDSSAIKSKAWCVYLIHGIDGDGGYSPLPSDTLRKSLEYLKKYPDLYWVTSFGNAARYIKERNVVSVKETSVLDSSITAQVTDTLDNAIFNVPLTFRRPLPDGWASATVAQNGVSMDAQIVTVNSVQTLQFDAVPNGGDVLIVKSGTTAVQSHSGIKVTSPTTAQNYPNPFNPSTTIEFSLPERSDVRLVLVNLSGQTVKELAAGSFAAGTHQVQLDASGLPSGVYYYQLRAGNALETKKLVLTR